MTLRFPLRSSSPQRPNSSATRFTPAPSFSFTSMPNFFRSLAMLSFLTSRAADSPRKSRTPLFSLKSPSSPLGFLEVEELKHLSSISLTSTLDSLLTKDLVLF